MDFKVLTAIILFASTSGVMASKCSVAANSAKSMPGSYVGASVESQTVIDAAEFAVEKINNGKLVTIVSAHTQVVAGTNYELVLQLKNRTGKIRTYEVVVFVPLRINGTEMQLKSVVELQS